jgi:misacylated tRNA(Ala) deacylase
VTSCWGRVYENVVAANALTNIIYAAFNFALTLSLRSLPGHTFRGLPTPMDNPPDATTAIAVTTPSIVGALACQKDSYLQTLETEVISCNVYIPPKGDSKSNKPTGPSKANGNSDSAAQQTWMIEFADSVLFPEGGGQHTDHGFITPLGVKGMSAIPIEKVQRHGLRCVHFSPTSLEVGTKVRQTVYFARRWDLMQQHTGQHLLSAITDSMDLPTLGWSMGQAGEMNYVELPRKPTDAEIVMIQQKCNATIRDNLPITVETPRGQGSLSLPADYDGEKGVVRFIKIGDLDYNACCGTHLKQTSHIGLVLLHHTQSVRGTNCRLFFHCWRPRYQYSQQFDKWLASNSHISLI